MANYCRAVIKSPPGTIPVANLLPVSMIPAENFSAGINDMGGNLPPVPTTPSANLPSVANHGNNIRLLRPVVLVLLIRVAMLLTPVANLPPVSTTPAANFATSFTSVVDTGSKFATGGKSWEQYQAAETLK